MQLLNRIPFVNAALRFARRLRRWLLAPILDELEACKSLQREFNTEVRPFVISLRDTMNAAPAHVHAINGSLNMLEQVSAAASVLKAFSENTLIKPVPTLDQYGRLRKMIINGYTLREARYDSNSKPSEFVKSLSGKGKMQPNKASLISRLTFGYFGRQLEKEINAIHDEMAEATILVRLMCEHLAMHQGPFKGIDFVRIDEQIRQAIRISEEALISMLVMFSVPPENP